MKKEIISIIEWATEELGYGKPHIEILLNSNFADFSSNVAFTLAKVAKKSPIKIAKQISEKINFKFDKEYICEVATPGFLNITLKSVKLHSFINNSLDLGIDIGKGEQKNRFVNIEYVSANPTGFMHVGHARNATIGSSIANVMEYSGYVVDREYYINDAGNQMNNMALSVHWRYMELLGASVSKPDEVYQGVDIIECAKALKLEYGDTLQKYEKNLEKIREFGLNFFLTKIKEHLKELRCKFDIFYSERTITRETIDKNISKMKNIYVKDGATWFKSTIYGDDKDRVLIKTDGTTTYFAPDVVYHGIKASRRNYDELIDIWGADHSGYVARMQYALEDLGYKKGLLNVLIMQMVKLIKNDVNIKMSKRLGTSVTMKDLIDDVGVDAARYYLTNKATNSEIEFDIDLTKSSRSENQVFYIQYAYARANQLIEKAKTNKIFATPLSTLEFEHEDLILVRKLLTFEDLLQEIAENKLLHLLNFYLLDLAKRFHSYYNSKKIMELENASEHIALVQVAKNVIFRGLDLLGINAPNKM